MKEDGLEMRYLSEKSTSISLSCRSPRPGIASIQGAIATTSLSLQVISLNTKTRVRSCVIRQEAEATEMSIFFPFSHQNHSRQNGFW